MPAIALITAGAGAAIRLFGPDSMGGQGDIGPRIDAEIARTGQSEDEIGPKVFPVFMSEGLADVVFQRYYFIQKENLSKFLAFLQCMITNLTRRQYVVF